MSSEAMVLSDLQALGLSSLGGRVYVALVHRDAWATGYEIAKDLGVARANVYDALRYLARMGFARERIGATGTQYAATPFATVAEAQLHELAERLERIQQGLPLRQPSLTLWQGVGWNAFREQTEIVVRSAVTTVRIGTSVQPIREVAAILDRAINPKVSVAYGCWQGCPPTGCGVCQEPIVSLSPWSDEPTCLIVVDDQLAVGSWGSSSEPTVLATTYPSVVAGWRALLSPVELA
ncbi:MAG: hypothetical protein M1600_09245 [Firmicutes bacterium]|nr:hypothetical protein [Bacillota bacterium]